MLFVINCTKRVIGVLNMNYVLVLLCYIFAVLYLDKDATLLLYCILIKMYIIAVLYLDKDVTLLLYCILIKMYIIAVLYLDKDVHYCCTVS